MTDTAAAAQRREAANRRTPMVIDVDTRPIPVTIMGHTFDFKGVLDTEDNARVLAPLQRTAGRVDTSDPDALNDLIGQVMVALAEMLDDQGQRDEWLAMRIPVAALVGTEGSVLAGLFAEWTGRPLGSA